MIAPRATRRDQQAGRDDGGGGRPRRRRGPRGSPGDAFAFEVPAPSLDDDGGSNRHGRSCGRYRYQPYSAGAGAGGGGDGDAGGGDALPNEDEDAMMRRYRDLYRESGLKEALRARRHFERPRDRGKRERRELIARRKWERDHRGDWAPEPFSGGCDHLLDAPYAPYFSGGADADADAAKAEGGADALDEGFWLAGEGAALGEAGGLLSIFGGGAALEGGGYMDGAAGGFAGGAAPPYQSAWQVAEFEAGVWTQPSPPAGGERWGAAGTAAAVLPLADQLAAEAALAADEAAAAAAAAASADAPTVPEPDARIDGAAEVAERLGQQQQQQQRRRQGAPRDKSPRAPPTPTRR